MKAAVIYEHGGPGSIRYETRFPDPKPAGGEVLVRVKATALNYHDIFTRRGMPGDLARCLNRAFR
jgi:alcohol dehydrogenase